MLFSRLEGNMEMPTFCIVIGSPPPRKPNWRTHVFKNFQVVIQAPFGNTDLLRAICRRAGAFVLNKMIEANKPLQ